jgi:hypothetical protein
MAGSGFPKPASAICTWSNACSPWPAPPPSTPPHVARTCAACSWNSRTTALSRAISAAASQRSRSAAAMPSMAAAVSCHTVCVGEAAAAAGQGQGAPAWGRRARQGAACMERGPGMHGCACHATRQRPAAAWPSARGRTLSASAAEGATTSEKKPSAPACGGPRKSESRAVGGGSGACGRPLPACMQPAAGRVQPAARHMRFSVRHVRPVARACSRPAPRASSMRAHLPVGHQVCNIPVALRALVPARLLRRILRVGVAVAAARLRAVTGGARAGAAAARRGRRLQRRTGRAAQRRARRLERRGHRGERGAGRLAAEGVVVAVHLGAGERGAGVGGRGAVRERRAGPNVTRALGALLRPSSAAACAAGAASATGGHRGVPARARGDRARPGAPGPRGGRVTRAAAPCRWRAFRAVCERQKRGSGGQLCWRCRGVGDLAPAAARSSGLRKPATRARRGGRLAAASPPPAPSTRAALAQLALGVRRLHGRRALPRMRAGQAGAWRFVLLKPASVPGGGAAVRRALGQVALGTRCPRRGSQCV